MEAHIRDPTRPELGSCRLPLSYGQEQLWFLEQLAPGESSHNLCVLSRLRGTLNMPALRAALGCVVARHDVLRAQIDAEDGRPFQVIAPAGEIDLSTDDLSSVPVARREQATLDAAARAGQTPFDLARGPLFRFRLHRIGPQDHLLSVVLHHSVADGWSIGVLHAEVSAAYEAYAVGREPDLRPLPVQYADLVERQRRKREEGDLERHLQYWEQQLAGLPTLELPTDRPRPGVLSHTGSTVVVELPCELLDGTRKLAQRRGVSVFMVLAAAFTVVLARHSGQGDISLGTTMLGRTEPEFERLIGFFVNMVVLRSDVSDDPSFSDLLDRMRDTTLDAYDHQEAPFEKVVERLNAPRDPSRNPLFQVCLQLLDDTTSGGGLVLPDLATKPVTPRVESSRFDLSLTFVDAADGFRASVEYSTALFDRHRVERMVGHVEQVLSAAVRDPSRRVSELPLLTPVEQEELLAAGYGPHEPFRRDPVHVLVAERAAAAPEDVAAVFEGNSLSYGELDRRAGHLARHLRRSGVGQEDIVGVALERSLDVLVALVGVLKAGAAFTVLDPSLPVSRLAFMLEETEAPIVITSSEWLARLPKPAGWSPVCLDQAWENTEAGAEESLEEWATGDSLAYVLYTSGSTGKPKGALIEHRALMSYLTSFVAMFELRPGDRMLQFASLSFDLSQAEIFSALTTGATLVLAKQDTLLSPEALSDLVRRERVTYIGAPPAMLALLEPEPYPELRNVLVGGEAFPGALVNKWNLPGRRFVNGYGPTEATIGCTMYACEKAVWRSSPPIGGPLLHRRLYVVDGHGNLLPQGVPGELLIGGDEGLARGYLHRPELTAERFIPDPFRSEGRVYRSGDLVRWTSELELEFVGRVDTQVKLRGLRIELEEIEAVLATHPAVARPAVTLREDARGDKRLVGYIVADGDQPSVAELRAHLEQSVPGYMVPAAWVFLDALPLSPTGKVQRSALPAPSAARAEDERETIPPSTPTEQRLAEIFADVLALSVSVVGADGDFFLLGGNSLQAMRVISRAHQSFAVEVGVRSLYGASTVAALARHIDGLERITPKAGDESPGRWELLELVERLSEDEAERILLAHGHAADAQGDADDG
jgi:amino acid adenylation domain-containing protein